MSNAELLQMVPHTAAKHLLLKLYLDRWFPILGLHSRRLNYIDSFSGPGKYQGGEKGSPIIAIESALAHFHNGTLSSETEVNFLFIERNSDFVKHLETEISLLELPPQFKYQVINGEFSDKVEAILAKLENSNRQLAPTFALVDPFGFSGIPFDLMARILRYPKCEVFINVMVEFINRFLSHPNESVVQHFPVTFGTDEILEIPNRDGKRVEQILSLYRSQLKKHAKYVGRFDMHGKKDQKTYSLFFASNAPRGFEKMKEAMWSVDKKNGNQFSDAFAKHACLFEVMGIESLWDEVSEKFRGQLVPMKVINQFVIEDTDFLPTHIRKIFIEQEQKNKISVEPIGDYKRRKGTYKEDKVKIQFP